MFTFVFKIEKLTTGKAYPKEEDCWIFAWGNWAGFAGGNLRIFWGT
jgi:hypothetical protein